MSRIDIPAHFYALDHWRTTQLILQAFLLWLIPGFLAYGAFILGSPMWLAIPVNLILAIVAGHGLQCVALLGHEGTHFALHPKRKVSAVLGVLLSSFAPFHQDVGFAISHADHHAFTNTKRDPDHIFFSSFKNFWSRLFLARIAASQRYLHATCLLAFGLWPQDRPIRVGLSLRDMIALARLNLVMSFTLLVVYLILTALFPLIMISVLWLPFIMAVFISGLRPYVEHAGTSIGRGRDSRSWISPVFDAIYGGINYHQAHHLFPTVPSYNLKALHRWMRDQGQHIDAESAEIHTIKSFLASAGRPLYPKRLSLREF